MNVFINGKDEFFYPIEFNELNINSLSRNYYLKISTNKDDSQTLVFGKTNIIHNIWMYIINSLKLKNITYIYGNDLSIKFNFTIKENNNNSKNISKKRTRDNIKKIIKLISKASLVKNESKFIEVSDKSKKSPQNFFLEVSEDKKVENPVISTGALTDEAPKAKKRPSSEGFEDHVADSGKSNKNPAGIMNEITTIPAAIFSREEDSNPFVNFSGNLSNSPLETNNPAGIVDEIITKTDEIETVTDQIKCLYQISNNNIFCEKDNEFFGISLEKMQEKLRLKDKTIKILHNVNGVPIYVLRFLQKGSFGKVFAYVSLDKDSPSIGAIKIGSTKNKENIHRADKDIKNEFRLLEKIHSNGKKIVGVQKAVRRVKLHLINKRFQEKLRHAIIGMRYDDDLFEFILKKDFLNEKKIEASIQLLNGLISIHEMGIVHNDIKPGNILVNQALNRYDFADFGSAADKINNHLSGTVPFCSYRGLKLTQEAFNNNNQEQWFEIRKKEDVFALGLTLYQIFQNNSFAKPYNLNFYGLLNIIEEDYTPITIEDQNQSLAINNLLKKMMACEPSERPTAEEALEEFKNPSFGFISL